MNAQPGETIPSTKSAITAIQSERKAYAVRQARRAPFFRGKLDHVDLDRLHDPREWAKIPLLDKAMLRAMSDPEFYRDFCLPPAEGDGIAQYWRSGGTTGRPLFYPRSRIDSKCLNCDIARAREDASVDADRLLGGSFRGAKPKDHRDQGASNVRCRHSETRKGDDPCSL
jgi:phenylacetate-CoA ligase